MAKLLSIGPLRFLGVISYSVFLLHSFVITADLAFRPDMTRIDHVMVPALASTVWLVPLVLVPAVLFWSTVSFALVERTFLQYRPREKAGAATGVTPALTPETLVR
jgi:peptidoglycan/LPS O-acetylase OafA/YrhL